MTDQQRADVSAREGFPLDTTPYIDDLARRGTWFDKAYTTMPACAPARVSFLTGRYPTATRVRTNHNLEDATYTRDLFDVMRENGYATALAGKNHSHLTDDRADYTLHLGHGGGRGDGRSTDERNFDDWLRGLNHRAATEATPFPLACQCPYRVVSGAIDWIRGLEDDPFFLWLSFPEPHNPYQVPEPYFSMFPPDDLPPTLSDETALPGKGFKFEWTRQLGETAFSDYAEQIPRARANYFGMLRMIDDQVRRFTEFLESQGIADDTLIVFLSDHGDFVGEYGLMRKGPELPDALARIPMQFTGPGVVANVAPHAAHVSIADILPTLCEAIGAETPDGVQGRSLWPMLTGAEYPQAEFESVYAEHGFGGLHYTADEPVDPTKDGLQPGVAFDCLNAWTQSGSMRMLRKGDWKIVMDMQGRGQLYNLAADPVELDNLYGDPDHAAKQTELLADLMAATLRAEDPLPWPRRRYVPKTDSRGYWAPYR
jgi:arylsulfatase A-like enzyme